MVHPPTEPGLIDAPLEDAEDAAEVPFQDWSYPPGTRTIDVAGQEIAYYVMGEGEPVVLCHPLATGAFLWNLNAPYLARRRRVVALDFPGFGRSSKPDCAYTMTWMAELLVAFLDRLELGPVTLVGNSMGGHIAMTTALTSPNRVRRLVLVNTTGVDRLHPGAIRIFHLLLEQAIGPRWVKAPGFLLDAGIRTIFHQHPPQVRALKRHFRAIQQGEGHVQHLRAITRVLRAIAHEGLSERLHEIRCPTLVVWGARDPLVPLRLGRRLSRSVPGARLCVFDDCAHFPQVEQPSLFNRALMAWLEGKELPPGLG